MQIIFIELANLQIYYNIENCKENLWKNILQKRD
jgi:hypothetical protein